MSVVIISKICKISQNIYSTIFKKGNSKRVIRKLLINNVTFWDKSNKSSAEKDKEQCERCQKIIDAIFGESKPETIHSNLQELPEIQTMDSTKLNQIITQVQLNAKAKSDQSQKVLNQVLPETDLESKGASKVNQKILSKTDQEKEQKLITKVETINEADVVKAPPEKDAPQKVPGDINWHDYLNIDNCSPYYSRKRPLSAADIDTELAKTASRCLKYLPDHIDSHILKQIRVLSVSSKKSGNASTPRPTLTSSTHQKPTVKQKEKVEVKGEFQASKQVEAITKGVSAQRRENFEPLTPAFEPKISENILLVKGAKTGTRCKINTNQIERIITQSREKLISAYKDGNIEEHDVTERKGQSLVSVKSAVVPDVVGKESAEKNEKLDGKNINIIDNIPEEKKKDVAINKKAVLEQAVPNVLTAKLNTKIEQMENTKQNPKIISIEKTTNNINFKPYGETTQNQTKPSKESTQNVNKKPLVETIQNQTRTCKEIAQNINFKSFEDTRQNMSITNRHVNMKPTVETTRSQKKQSEQFVQNINMKPFVETTQRQPDMKRYETNRHFVYTKPFKKNRQNYMKAYRGTIKNQPKPSEDTTQNVDNKAIAKSTRNMYFKPLGITAQNIDIKPIEQSARNSQNMNFKPIEGTKQNQTKPTEDTTQNINLKPLGDARQNMNPSWAWAKPSQENTQNVNMKQFINTTQNQTKPSKESAANLNMKPFVETTQNQTKPSKESAANLNMKPFVDTTQNQTQPSKESAENLNMKPFVETTQNQTKLSEVSAENLNMKPFVDTTQNQRQPSKESAENLNMKQFVETTQNQTKPSVQTTQNINFKPFEDTSQNMNLKWAWEKPSQENIQNVNMKPSVDTTQNQTKPSKESAQNVNIKPCVETTQNQTTPSVESAQNVDTKPLEDTRQNIKWTEPSEESSQNLNMKPYVENTQNQTKPIEEIRQNQSKQSEETIQNVDIKPIEQSARNMYFKPLGNIAQSIDIKPLKESTTEIKPEENTVNILQPKEVPHDKSDVETASLEELLKQVRERNRSQRWGNPGARCKGKCGDKKPPCPPPAPKCPPPPPPPPCPAPCPKPEPAPACPPDPPCDPPKPCPKPTCFQIHDNEDLNPIYIREIYLLNIQQTSFSSKIQDEDITRSFFGGITNLLAVAKSAMFSIIDDIVGKVKFNICLIRGFDPWTPVPSWPMPEKRRRKPPICPKEGCQVPVPPKTNPPCKLYPCKTYPKNI